MAILQAPTLERLLREVRVTLGQPKAENSRFSDEELANYLNDGIRQYFAHINEMAEGQFDKSTTLNIVSGSETIDLPSDCFTVKVLFKKQSNYFKPLAYRNNIIEPYDNTESITNSNGYEPMFYLRMNKIVLRPTPGFNETAGLTLEYTAFPDQMLFGADAMTSGISPIFKELVVMYAVFKAKLKDDLNNGTNTRTAVESHLAGLYANFKHQVEERAKSPQFISNYDP